MTRKLAPLFAALAVLFLSVGLAAAQEPVTPVQGTTQQPNAYTFAPLGMGLVVIGVGIGLGMIGYGAMSGIARQPEQADNIRTTMLIIGGLVEGAGIIGLVLCLVAKA